MYSWLDIFKIWQIEIFPQNVDNLGYPSNHEIVFVLVEITFFNRFLKSENLHPKNSLWLRPKNLQIHSWKSSGLTASTINFAVVDAWRTEAVAAGSSVGKGQLECWVCILLQRGVEFKYASIHPCICRMLQKRRWRDFTGGVLGKKLRWKEREIGYYAAISPWLPSNYHQPRLRFKWPHSILDEWVNLADSKSLQLTCSSLFFCIHD
jgi:hypothetical protein